MTVLRIVWSSKISPIHVDCRKCCQLSLATVDARCDKLATVVMRTSIARSHYITWTELNWRNYSERVISSGSVHIARTTVIANCSASDTAAAWWMKTVVQRQLVAAAAAASQTPVAVRCRYEPSQWAMSLRPDRKSVMPLSVGSLSGAVGRIGHD